MTTYDTSKVNNYRLLPMVSRQLPLKMTLHESFNFRNTFHIDFNVGLNEV